MRELHGWIALLFAILGACVCTYVLDQLSRQTNERRCIEFCSRQRAGFDSVRYGYCLCDVTKTTHRPETW